MGNRCVILKWKNKILSLLFKENRLLRVQAEEETESLLGNIYIGKVKNTVKNMEAAFVEISPEITCFLSLRDAKKPLLLNRKYDGRILVGDELPVQVDREALKTKPPGVTTALSLSGKYSVVSLGRPGIAYSAKLSQKVRERMMKEYKEIYEAVPPEFGVVIRTNAKDITDSALFEKELKGLAQALQELVENAPHRTCFSVLYRKEPAYLTGLRDIYTGDCDEIVTDREDIYEEISRYEASHPGYLPGTLRLYEDDMLPLHKLYNVEKKVKEALGKKVWLKSGGYLIIEPTEALTVIDVNTGKSSGKKRQEEAFLKINREAAAEIAMQLMLRNISGVILVDFINMEQEESQHELMAYFGDLLKKDPVKTTLVDITVLGLVEITRRKINKPLWEQLKDREAVRD